MDLKQLENSLILGMENFKDNITEILCKIKEKKKITLGERAMLEIATIISPEFKKILYKGE